MPMCREDKSGRTNTLGQLEAQSDEQRVKWAMLRRGLRKQYHSYIISDDQKATARRLLCVHTELLNRSLQNVTVADDDVVSSEEGAGEALSSRAEQDDFLRKYAARWKEQQPPRTSAGIPEVADGLYSTVCGGGGPLQDPLRLRRPSID